MKTYEQQSRRTWGNLGHQEKATNEDINTGALQRIATAMESIAESSQIAARNHDALLRELKWSRDAQADLCKRNEELSRVVSSLKGVITKQRKKLKP